MAKKDLTELVFVIDKSGSMSGLESDTVDGYNALLKSNREGKGEAVVSTVLFDNDVRVLHDRVPIERVRPLSERDYVPGGCTALLDAVGGAIRYHERVQKILPESLRPEHTLICIATDGYENASSKYTYPQVKHMIDAARERGWEFLFLGRTSTPPRRRESSASTWSARWNSPRAPRAAPSPSTRCASRAPPSAAAAPLPGVGANQKRRAPGVDAIRRASTPGAPRCQEGGLMPGV